MAAALEGMTMHAGAFNTTFTGEIRDQSQLYRLLDRVGDLGMELVSVQPDSAGSQRSETNQFPMLW
jgi:hypothetical protein